jgi:hypothetical protein
MDLDVRYLTFLTRGPSIRQRVTEEVKRLSTQKKEIQMKIKSSVRSGATRN